MNAGAICVVHLVWGPLGIAPFREFLASYRRHPSGVQHRLLVVFNGFGPKADQRSYHEALSSVAHDCLVLPSAVQDLQAYLIAARQCPEHNVCFLNSYSVIRHEDWLRKLHDASRKPGVGLVGATGSHESFFNKAKKAVKPLTDQPGWRGWMGRARVWRALRRWKQRFPAFPNPHLRSNGFMIETTRLLALKTGPLRTKDDCLQFESGWNSLTRQVLGQGLRVLIVDGAGKTHAPEDWEASETYRAGEQRNLLIADNRTRHYEEAGAEERREFTRATWRE